MPGLGRWSIEGILVEGAEGALLMGLMLFWVQRSGGMLPEAQARSLLVGIGPATPPPTLTGLPFPKQTVTQQTWQAAPQACHSPTSWLCAHPSCFLHASGCTPYACHLERFTLVTTHMSAKSTSQLMLAAVDVCTRLYMQP